MPTSATKGMAEAEMAPLIAAKQSYQDKRAALENHYSAVLESLRLKQTNAELADDFESLESLKDGAKDFVATELSGKMGVVKDHASELGMFRKNLLQAVKLRTSGSLPKAADTVAQQGPPIIDVAIKICSELEEKRHNFSTSVYEAKAGLRAALVPPVSPEASLNMYDAVGKLPSVKKGKKDVMKDLKKVNYALYTETDPSKVRKFFRVLGAAFDPQALTTYTVPKDAAWGAKVTHHQVWAATSTWVHIGFSPFGAMDARLVLEGSLVAIGVATQAIPGSSIKEKRRNLLVSTKDGLMELVKRDGFAAMVASPGLLVIPTGVIVVMCAVESALGVRWTVGSDAADIERTAAQLKNLIDEFPELRSQSVGYTPFCDFLSRE